MKSVNQWYNKKKAKLMSFIGKIIDSGFVFNPVRINIL